MPITSATATNSPVRCDLCLTPVNPSSDGFDRLIDVCKTSSGEVRHRLHPECLSNTMRAVRTENRLESTCPCDGCTAANEQSPSFAAYNYFLKNSQVAVSKVQHQMNYRVNVAMHKYTDYKIFSDQSAQNNGMPKKLDSILKQLKQKTASSPVILKISVRQTSISLLLKKKILNSLI